MDQLQKLNQRISDFNVAIEYKKKQVFTCQEQLSLARIATSKDDGKIQKLTGQIDSLKREIEETLPAEIVKTEEAIEVAKKEEHESFMKQFEKEAKLSEWRKKSKELLAAVREAEVLNKNIRDLYGAYVELKKKKGEELSLEKICTGFHKALETIANECEKEIKGEGRQTIRWPAGWPL